MFGAAFSGLSSAPAGAQPAVSNLAMRTVAGTVPPEPVEAGLDADNLLSHLLEEFETIRTGGVAATAHPAWTVFASRLTDGSVFAPLVGEEVTSAELNKQISELRAQVEQLRKIVDPNG